MEYLVVLLALFTLEILYFYLAGRFNIVDKPNKRSSHEEVTLRGGGIIFYFAVVVFFFFSDFQYPWFFLGLTLMSIISFLDDVFTLSNRVRLFIHFISVLLLAIELDALSLPWYYLVITFIFVVGVINAYNFMDGINGITACYSLAVSGLLTYVNYHVNFVNQDLLLYTMLGIIVFMFFNFRNKAKTFAGDVGSIAIAFILLFALGLLIFKTGKAIYVLFLSVYGVDAIWTIIRRVILKEDIFKAHRSHLYQYLANEASVNKLVVAFSYGLLQVVIGAIVILLSNYGDMIQLIGSVLILVLLSILYLITKKYVLNKFVHIVTD